MVEVPGWSSAPAHAPATQTAVERKGGNRLLSSERGATSKEFTSFRNENGSGQDQNPALTGSCVPNWLDGGLADVRRGCRAGSVYRGTSLMRTPPFRRTLRQDYTKGPMIIRGGGAFLMSEVTLYASMSPNRLRSAGYP